MYNADLRRKYRQTEMFYKPGNGEFQECHENVPQEFKVSNLQSSLIAELYAGMPRAVKSTTSTSP